VVRGHPDHRERAFLVGVLATMAFLPLSQDHAAAGAPEQSYFQTSSTVLESTTDLAYALGQSVFAVGAAMLYSLLHPLSAFGR
jgi:hypothetical protein